MSAPDAYLMAQTAPPQTLTIEKYAGGASIRLLTPVGRASFVHLDKPAPKTTGGKPYFSVNLIFAPAACGDLLRAIVMLADAHWEKQFEPFLSDEKGIIKLRAKNSVPGGVSLHTPLKAGDYQYAVKPDMNAAYQGMYYMNPSSAADKQPSTVDERNTPVDPASIYSGCYARAFIDITTIRDQAGYTKGVTAYLRSVQFARHGERMQGFDVSAAASSAFAAVPLPPDPNGGLAPQGGAPQGGVPLGAATAGGVAPGQFHAPAAAFAPPSAIPLR